jgi:hypothetical protein
MPRYALTLKATMLEDVTDAAGAGALVGDFSWKS